MKPNISILIVSYNSGHYLRACIDSIFRSKTQYAFEIIVVDNHSGDNTLELLETYGSNIKWIANDYNYGFSKAMNQAMEKATGEYILTFNPDAELLPDSLEKALDFFYNHQNVGLIAPWILDSKGKGHLPNYNLPIFDGSSTWIFFFQKLWPVRQIQTSKEIKFVFGTGLIVERNLLEGDSLYPENTFLFWEEYFLCKTVQKAKKALLIYPPYSILHHRSVSFKFDKEKIEWMQKMILPFGFHLRVQEHGRFLATLNYLYKSVDNLVFWVVLKIISWIGIQKDALRRTALVNASYYLKSPFLSKEKSDLFHKEAMIYFNKGKKPPLVA